MRTLTRAPCFMPGEYLQVANPLITASSSRLPADSTTWTSVTSPASVTTKASVTEARCPFLSCGALWGNSTDPQEILFGFTSVSFSLTVRMGGGAGVVGGSDFVTTGFGVGTGTSCASTRAVLPAVTATRLDHGS